MITRSKQVVIKAHLEANLKVNIDTIIFLCDNIVKRIINYHRHRSELIVRWKTLSQNRPVTVIENISQWLHIISHKWLVDIFWAHLIIWSKNKSVLFLAFKQSNKFSGISCNHYNMMVTYHKNTMPKCSTFSYNPKWLLAHGVMQKLINTIRVNNNNVSWQKGKCASNNKISLWCFSILECLHRMYFFYFAVFAMLLQIYKIYTPLMTSITGFFVTFKAHCL